VILRPARPEDLAAVHALEQQVFGADAWSAASVSEELLGPRRVALVACEGDRVVGYLVTATAGDVVDLQRVAVRPGSRRQGLAHRLVAAAGERAGGRRMLLEVAAGNEAALAFYAAEGFVEIDRRRRYYRDGSDAVVMARPPAAGGPAPGRGARGATMQP
jgi:ribosomal-protein-alanine N-acetyltransferase